MVKQPVALKIWVKETQGAALIGILGTAIMT